MKYFLGIFACLALLTQFVSAQEYASDWTYIEIDNEKNKWGDYDQPEWLRYFGLAMGDLNNDGKKDILTGRNVYLNPGNDFHATWEKIDLGMNVDGILVMDIDGDEFADIIAQALPAVYWLEATDKSAKKWKSAKIGEIPATSHVNSQGFEKAQIISGGKEEFLIAGDGDIYCFEIPDRPEEEQWTITLVAENTSDEGIGTGDIDGDGDVDIAVGRRPEGSDEPLLVVWYENPGDGSKNWKSVIVGKANHPADRFEIADINGDKRADIIVTEERYPGKEPDGNLFWYEQPIANEAEWERHWIVTQYSMNNLDIFDIDKDGDIDLLTCEHKGPQLELQIWENNGYGSFSKNIIDLGKESHLGTQVADMDEDGDLDIVSIGWDKYKYVHLWINEGSTD
ncbi:VCBS repeat-containing protein [uncultured Draconibacterium sp.]|uniref:FG-GAP repeat domain-containing protein n=1 Tax=uncultured Draconibacterium sp. TaxID=1573823 RepID=UPI0029C87B2F|nr:VCBS repeat-containing protein [uncultured Draconibacterium sp.]